MAEVPGSPYEPFFTAQPTERPIQLRGVDAPGAAFGENIANAVRTFGGDVEQAGNEVFNRAMALRKLQIDGTIRDLTTQYYNEVAPIQSDFLAAKGANASQDSLNEHLARLETVRQKYEQQANQYGPYGVNRFGEEAASLQRSFIREGAVYSATQTKAAARESRGAALDVLSRQWANTPGEFDQKSAKAKVLIRQQVIEDGGDENVVKDKSEQFDQGLRVAQILRTSWGNPQAGMLLLEMHKEELGGKEGEVYNNVRRQVEQRFLAVEGDRLSDHVANQLRTTGGSVEDAVASAKKAVANDPVASQIPGAESRIAQDVRAKVRAQNFDTNQDADQNIQYILSKLAAPGASFTSMADLEASDPKIKDIESQLLQSKRGAAFMATLPNKIQHDWTAAHSAQMDENYRQLLGEGLSTDPRVREQFLQHTADFHEFELKKADWAKLMSRRAYILAHPEEENPIVKRALSIAKINNGQALKELKIDKLTDDTATLYHKWTGSLSMAIDEWKSANPGKALSDKALEEEIIRPAIMERWEGGLGESHYFGRRRGAFDFDISKDDLRKWKESESERMTKTYGQSVTPDQINDEEAYQAASRFIWNKLYSKPNGTTGGTSPPISR